MSKNTAQVNRFIRNSLERISNNSEDRFLNRLEDRLYTLGQYIQQRQGTPFYEEMLNHICSDRT